MKNYISQFNSEIISSSFGYLSDGSEVFTHKITNKNGLEICASTYGACITSLKIPINNTEKIDVVLGFDSAADYEKSFSLPNAPYIGAAVGLYAGRIKNASFELNGSKIQLHKNHGKHQLHGGFINLSNQIWDFNGEKSNQNQLVFQINTKLNSINYQANATVEVHYILSEENALIVRFYAKTNQATPINLTQHSYFNLDGTANSVVNQKLSIYSESFLEVDSEGIPTGILRSTKNTPFDFSQPKACPSEIDNTFALSQPIAAALYSPKTKINLLVFTNQPSVHIYVGGNCFDKLVGKDGATYGTTSGICFETQNYPDAPNHKNFPNSIIEPTDTYFHESIFQFETNKTE